MTSPAPAVVSVAERVIAGDPALVWSLLGDPARVGEWAGVRVVGYMGTELPKPGQSLFVRGRVPGSRQRRVEVAVWEAGEKIGCIVHTDRSPVRFEVEIHPEVEPGRITTRVRLTQRTQTPVAMRGIADWWIGRQLERRLDRIERTAAS